MSLDFRTTLTLRTKKRIYSTFVLYTFNEEAEADMEFSFCIHTLE